MSGRAPFGSRGRGESDGWADVIDDPDDYVNAFSEGPVHSFCSSPSLLLFYLFIHLVLRLAAHSVGAQFPSVRMLDSGNRKKGATAAIVATWRRRVEKEEGGPRATELAFQSSMAGELVTSEVIETSPPSIYLYIFVGPPPL